MKSAVPTAARTRPAAGRIHSRAVAIVQANHRNLYSIAVMTRRYFPYTQFSSAEISRRLSTRNIFYYVAIAGGHSVGFVDFELKGESAQVLGLAVLEEYRGRGIATRLLRHAIAQAKRISASRGAMLAGVDLMVLEENASARGIYEREGFACKGVLAKELWGKKIAIYSKELARPARAEVA